MLLRIKQFLAMAGLTALEALRQPICLLLTVGCVVSIAAVPLLLLHAFGEDGKQVRDGALAFHFVFGVFIAVNAASTLLAREMKSGTASAVLSKPVSRELFLFSKFAGITLVVLIFSACATIATLLSERVGEKFYYTSTLAGYAMDSQVGAMLLGVPFAACLIAAYINYRFKRPFASTAFVMLSFLLVLVLVISGFFEIDGRWLPYNCRVQWRIIPVSLLITMALIVLLAIAITISTRFDTVPTLVVCSTIFMLGLMSDYLFGRFAGVSWISATLYTLVPNWQHFWAADALLKGGHVPWKYVVNAGMYAAVYTTAVLSLGMISFRHAEMK